MNDSVVSKNKKVYIGLSGGVDSSVSAALLVEQGYDVTGVFIKVWQPDFIECTWKEDRLDAMRVAATLNIPFITLDLEKEYKEGVIDYMIEEYKNGRTPNPDVMCNREVKFGAFYEWVKKQDKDAYIATGHYAQIVKDENGFHLKKSFDENKDQTYFLWTLSSDILSSTLFPISGMEKSNVRKLAEKFKLSVATKKDSQGLCFVGTIDVKELLKNYIKEKEGEIHNVHGECIGVHPGVMFFTIGERHGFTITKKGTDDTPYFVIGKNFDSNVLIVSHTPPSEKSGATIEIKDATFTLHIEKGAIYEGRGRYRAPLAKFEALSNTEFRIVDGEFTSTPGQSLVLYKENICIGGGLLI